MCWAFITLDMPASHMAAPSPYGFCRLLFVYESLPENHLLIRLHLSPCLPLIGGDGDSTETSCSLKAAICRFGLHELIHLQRCVQGLTQFILKCKAHRHLGAKKCDLKAAAVTFAAAAGGSSWCDGVLWQLRSCILAAVYSVCWENTYNTGSNDTCAICHESDHDGMWSHTQNLSASTKVSSLSSPKHKEIRPVLTVVWLSWRHGFV